MEDVSPELVLNWDQISIHLVPASTWTMDKQTMVQYITKIIVLYIEAQRDALGDSEESTLVIMDNFKGQVTPVINELLEANHIHFLPSSAWHN